MSELLLTTQRTQSNFKLQFYKANERRFAIVQEQEQSNLVTPNDLRKIAFEAYGGKEPVFVDVTIEQYKRSKSSSLGISLDKKQVELLISELQQLADKMIY